MEQRVRPVNANAYDVRDRVLAAGGAGEEEGKVDILRWDAI
jgi:hypothetical protein